LKLPHFLPLQDFPSVFDEAARALRVSDAYAQSLAAAGQQRIPDKWNEDDWNDSSVSSEAEGEEDGEEEEEDGDERRASDEWSSSPRSRSDSVVVADNFLASTPDFDSLFSGASSFSATAAPVLTSTSAQDQASMLDSIFAGVATPTTNKNGNNNNNTNDTSSVIEDEGTFYPPSPQKFVCELGEGGLRVEYSFQRRKSGYGDKYSLIELALTNESDAPLQGVNISDTKGFDVHVFTQIAEIAARQSVTVDISVFFADAVSAVELVMSTDDAQFPLKLEPVVGELFRPTKVDWVTFTEDQSRAEHESVFKIGDKSKDDDIASIVIDVANLFRVRGGSDDEIFYFGEFGLDARVYVQISRSAATGRVRSNDGKIHTALANYLAKHLS
jgi:hypothetical protein